jgi:hypothetical protein
MEKRKDKHVLSAITLKRPRSCTDCVLSYYDTEAGCTCCTWGGELPNHDYCFSKGHASGTVHDPESALANGFTCLFIDSEYTQL